jgi:hypothetical protein
LLSDIGVSARTGTGDRIAHATRSARWVEVAASIQEFLELKAQIRG